MPLWIGKAIIICTMESMDNEEVRKIFGEILADQLKAIHEYVKEIPGIKRQLAHIEDRLDRIEARLDMHEVDIRYLRSKFA